MASCVNKFNYHTAYNNISDDTVLYFMELNNKDDIICIPGIDHKSRDNLYKNGINNLLNLIGKFLILLDNSCTAFENLNEFYLLLGELGVNNRNKCQIVRLIAEKVNIMMPGTIDFDEFQE